MFRDDDLQRLLRALGRAPAPDVALDAVFERWHRRRRGKLVLSSVALAGLLSAGILFFVPARSEPAPVHLKLKLVQVVEEEQPLDAETPEGRGP